MTSTSALSPAPAAPPTFSSPPSVRAFAWRVLHEGSLEAKLAPPQAAGGGLLDDDAPGPAVVVDRPARQAPLLLHEGSEKLPKLHELTNAAARARCLARFAHHELMAVELFAWALLAFPQAPAALRRGFVAALAEEQLHCRLYLERLAAHGGALGDEPLSDYFWRHLPAIAGAPDPLLAFLCAQGLTLEQANLDFTMLYRDAFARAGDAESAAVLQRVHDDEVAHVRLAALWATKLSGQDDDATYQAHVPFPFAASRAKSRRFERGARKRAGLSDAFIARVEHAQPTRGRVPDRA